MTSSTPTGTSLDPQPAREVRLNPCLACGKSQSDLAAPLKRCSQCKGAWYCSRECQVGDWARHKTQCRPLPSTSSSSTTNASSSTRAEPSGKPGILKRHGGAGLAHTSGSGPGPGPMSPGMQATMEQEMAMLGREEARSSGASGGGGGGGGSNLYLTSFRTHADAIHHLIDAFRLRAEDEDTMAIRRLGVYNPDKDKATGAMRDFKAYLDLAEHGGVLPAWWTPAKRATCERLAADSRGGYYVCDESTVMDQDFVEVRYGDEVCVAMQLRNLAADVYGRGVPRW